MKNQNEQIPERANFMRRFTACIIDLFVITLIMIGVAAIDLGTDFFDKYELTYIQTTLFTIICLGLILFFSKDSYRGISFGRWIMGIMVRNDVDNEVPSYMSLFIRNLFILVWPVELIILLVNTDKKRLADKVSKTIVLENSKETNRLFRIGVLFLIVFGFYFFAEFYGSALITNSEAYEIAVESIEQNENIIDKTGGIVGYEGMEGFISMDDEIGKAEFKIKVNGEENNVVVRVYLEKKTDEEWIIKEIK